MRINKHDTQGTKPLLGKGELGYDDYVAGGDVGRVYVGTGSENIALAEKSEIVSHVNRVDNPHNVTKAQVGLGNVDNTADANKNVLSATKLTTARTITLSGDVTGSVSFNGSSNVDIVSTVADNSHNHTIANVTGLQEALDNKVDDSEKGTANGVATLDVNGKVTITQIPDSVLGQLEYQGVWDFTTLPIATQKGQYWIASVSGNGYIVGDWAVWNGTAFDKVDNTDAVASVAGRTGNVVLTKSDVALDLVDNTADSAKNVLSATKFTTARNIALTGDVTGNINFDGSSNVSIATTIAANSVALGTDTTGNYVAGATAGTGISISGTAGEGWSPTIALATAGTAGTYTKVTTDAYGRVTTGTNPTTLSGYGITDAYAKTEIDTVNLFRADKFLATQNIANMIYTNGDLTKIRYNNDTDVNYEVLNYVSGNLSSINHYTGGVLRGTTTLSYLNGNLVSAVFVGV